MHPESEIKVLTDKIVEFTTERDWDQFHNPKDLALALSIEAAELNEVFLWKKPEEANIDKIKEELADVFSYCFQMADKLEVNPEEIILNKLIKKL